MAQFLFCSATIGDELVILSYFLVGFSVQMCTFDSARGSILGEKCEAGNTASKKRGVAREMNLGIVTPLAILRVRVEADTICDRILNSLFDSCFHSSSFSPSRCKKTTTRTTSLFSGTAVRPRRQVVLVDGCGKKRSEIEIGGQIFLWFF